MNKISEKSKCKQRKRHRDRSGMREQPTRRRDQSNRSRSRGRYRSRSSSCKRQDRRCLSRDSDCRRKRNGRSGRLESSSECHTPPLSGHRRQRLRRGSDGRHSRRGRSGRLESSNERHTSPPSGHRRRRQRRGSDGRHSRGDGSERLDSSAERHTSPASNHYLGSFPAGGGEHSARVETVSRRLHLMKEESGHAIPVLVVVALTGVKVCDPEDQSVRMSHALRRISYATCEATRALFAFVAREPRCEPSAQYCHAFETDSPEQAEELNTLVGDAFRMAFASQLQPSAPLWSKELSSGSCTRAPDTLPGLTHHYPHCLDRSPSQCDIMGGSKLDPCEASEPSEASEASPSSSEDWNSPTELSCYRRLGERLERMERPPLMKRLALGLSGALLQPSDDDATPLVTDTPTTDPHSSPTNVPLCLNGGYINEASEAEARRERREPRVGDKDFRTCNNITNGRPSTGSAATSSSSGESSCSRASGNNNNNNTNLRPLEPELRHAPWFQQGIPREIALEVLGAQAPGAFLVRGSTTQAGCLALSLRVPGDFAPLGIAHYLILRTPKGYKIKGFTKEFSSLSALVTHHSVMPELLPVALRLPRRATPRRAERESIDSLSRPPNLRPQQDV